MLNGKKKSIKLESLSDLERVLIESKEIVLVMVIFGEVCLREMEVL